MNYEWIEWIPIMFGLTIHVSTPYEEFNESKMLAWKRLPSGEKVFKCRTKEGKLFFMCSEKLNIEDIEKIQSYGDCYE